MRAALLAKLASLLAAAAVTAGAGRAHACAGCRNPNIPITRLSDVHLQPRQLRASAVLSATTLNVVHEAGCADPAACAEVPAQPRFNHDQNIYPVELRAVLELGLTPGWGVEAQIPFRLTRTSVRYTTPDGQPYAPLDPDVHHRNETVAGLADPWLLGRYATVFGDVLVTARAGLTLPLGHTEEDPFALGSRGLRHQHIQLGNGTFDPLLAVDVSRAFGRVQLGGFAMAQLTLYDNDKGFRAGNRWMAGLQGGTPLVAGLVGALGLDLLHESPERWGGKIQQDGNLGRTELLAGLSLTRSFRSTMFSLVARVPIYRDVNNGDQPPGRLSSPLLLSLVASYTF
jgi:hypothetical protein